MKPRLNQRLQFSLAYLLVAATVLLVLQSWLQAPRTVEIPMSRFLDLRTQRQDREGRAHRAGDPGHREARRLAHRAERRRRPPPSVARPRSAEVRVFTVTRIPGVEEAPLVAELERHKIEFTGRIESTFVRDLVFGWIIPLGVMVAIWMLLMRRVGGGPTQALSFGRSKHKIFDRKELKTTFGDVAGVDEAKAELVEIVDFLKNPREIPAARRAHPQGRAAGGPAGHGQDAAGAGGRRRGRRARSSPCPAPSSSRCSSASAPRACATCSSRPRTRRPASSSSTSWTPSASRGPGSTGFIGRPRRARADAQPAPGRDGRLRLLEGRHHHGRHQPARGARPGAAAPRALRPPGGRRQARPARARGDPETARPRGGAGARTSTSAIIAARTPGFAGADLANIVNEAALLAARKEKSAVEMADFEEAIDRVVAGLEKKSRVLSEKERDIVAHHEMGHALVATVGRARRSRPQGDDHPARGRRARDDLPAADRGALPDDPERARGPDRGAAGRTRRRGARLRRGLDRRAQRPRARDRAGAPHGDEVRDVRACRASRPTASARRCSSGARGIGGEREYSEATARTIDEEVRAILERTHDRVRGHADDEEGRAGVRGARAEADRDARGRARCAGRWPARA